jgi:hypothetical protein
MNKDWSDDEDNEVEELVQPSRDFPINDEENEEEEYDYDMYELTKLTMNKTSDDLFNTNLVKNKKEKENNIKKEKIVNSIWKNENKEVKNTRIRKFNPRLPPPNKYNKNNKNMFYLNMKDFPSL